jgi:hypothetical protein
MVDMARYIVELQLAPLVKHKEIFHITSPSNSKKAVSDIGSFQCEFGVLG